MRCLPFCHLAHFDASEVQAAYHVLLLQERPSDSCESMSEATSQPSTACDSLATLQAVGTDSSPSSSPDSHLHKSQQEYTSAAAEMSLRHDDHDCCEGGASMSDAASSSTIIPAQGAAAPCAQSIGSEVCTMMSHTSLQFPHSRVSSNQAFNNASISSFLHDLPPSFTHSFIHSFIHSCFHSFIHPFIHAFILAFFFLFLILSCFHSFLSLTDLGQLLQA